MHPAFSVIFFTTTSGAGYGLLALLGIFGAAGIIPSERWFGFTGLAVALGFIGVGLLSSTFHLGHPERAWRALTQWRSSWLAREGVLAVLTFIPAGLLAIGWVFLETTNGFWGVMGIITAILAWLTVVATSMIYRSLATIFQWANFWTLPGYLMLSIMTGALMLGAIVVIFDHGNRVIQGTVILSIAVAWVLKYVYWQYIATHKSLATPSSAIAVDGAKITPLDPPHNSANYLMKEMGYVVARKHAEKLRAISHITLFALPLVLSIAVYFTNGPVAIIASVVAMLSSWLGVAVERWLFFAEAKHTVTLYYGAQSV